jgi:hypothetical protein
MSADLRGGVLKSFFWHAVIDNAMHAMAIIFGFMIFDLDINLK